MSKLIPVVFGCLSTVASKCDPIANDALEKLIEKAGLTSSQVEDNKTRAIGFCKKI